MSYGCVICGSDHSMDTPCPSEEELAAHIIADAIKSRPCPKCTVLEAEVAHLRERYERWWKQAMESRRERVSLEARLTQLHATSDIIFASYRSILALFDCPIHGECTPYVIQKIEGDRALLRELAAAVRVLDGEVPHTTGWKRARETMLSLLRRAEEAGGAR